MVLEQPLAQPVGILGKRQKIGRVAASVESLRLLIVTQFFPPDFAATGQLIEELVQQLGRQDVKVRVFTGQPGYAFAKGSAPTVEQQGNVWVRRSRMAQLFPGRIRGKAINGLMYTLRAVLHLLGRAYRYDVVLVTTAPPFLPVVAYLANLLLGLPYVCLLYDLYPDIAVELDVVKAHHPIAKVWRWINRQVWQRSSGIIVLSDSMKQRVAESCPAIVGKISVIHSWSNPGQIVPIKKADNWFAKKHRLIEPFVVMYSGNMGRCHDVDTIFAAAEKLCHEPIVFVCIGGGAKRQPLIDRVSAAGLNNFLFLPYQEKAVLPYSLTACDLSLVSVAAGMESLVAPSKLYPAMATGRPVAAVCPPTSYLGPLLSAAQGGAAFDNGEAAVLAQYILELSHNRDKAEALGASGREYMQENFTPSVISQQYLQVLKIASKAAV